MVYSVMYYASEAITRFIVGIILRIYEVIEKRRMVEEAPREEKPGLPRYGFFQTVNQAGVTEIVYVGRDTKLRAHIPILGIRPVVETVNAPPPPERLYFTFTEAASKEWFREIEWLAEQLEKQRKRGEKG